VYVIHNFQRIRLENGGRRTKIKKKTKFHYICKVRNWIELESTSAKNNNIESGDSADCSFDVASVDPITCSIEKCTDISDDIEHEERGEDLEYQKTKTLANDVSRAYKGIFDHIMTHIKKEFESSLQVEGASFENGDHPSDDATEAEATPIANLSEDSATLFHDSWTHRLNKAVKDGKPADFSNFLANRIYSLEKLLPRVRYLYYLLMDYNPISNRIRKLFMPSKDGNEDTSDVCVCSIGGGPGYDHISLCILSLFLRYVQSSAHAKSYRVRTVRTRVFDLFADDWQSIMDPLELSTRNSLSRTVKELDLKFGEPLINQEERVQESQMTMHPCDIRMDLDGEENKELRNVLARTDIICLQYVLHENSSIIAPDKNHSTPNNLIHGVVFDLLKRAKIGTFMICTDSNNFVWPVLKASAEACGWIFLGDAEKAGKVTLGPKSFVILERIRIA
jgi:hypothetical protein